jgi:hypothetical protein
VPVILEGIAMMKVKLTDAPQQTALFGKSWELAGWLRAAQSWGLAEGVEIERWRVDGRFLAGGKWYVVERAGESWEVKSVQ